MLKHRRSVSIIALLLSTATLFYISSPNQSFADSWRAPHARIFASANGEYGFVHQLQKGYLFKMSRNGEMKTLWKNPLVSIPIDAYVSNKGHFIMLDEYGMVGYNHVLVLYSPEGKLLADYKLTDLLTEQEIKEHTSRTVSSRWWRNNAQLTFNNRHTHAQLKLKWGKTIQIDLTTAKLTTEKDERS